MATVSDGWRRSSFCSSHTCVEVKLLDTGYVALRVNPSRVLAPQPGWPQVLSPEEFAAFIAGVKAGEFDDLAGESSR